MKPYCSYSLDQIAESHLIPASRMLAIVAEVESRIEKAFDSQGHALTNCALAAFPNGERMLYPRMDHDPKGEYIRRELLAHVLTPEELKLVNDCCSTSWRENTDAKRFEKATKLTQWDGWVTDGNDYWESVEDYLEDRGAGEGTYLWCCQPQRVIPDLDVAGVTEHWVCDRGWEDMDEHDLNGVAALQAALDAFVEANKGVVSYRPDYAQAVLLADYIRTKEADDECNSTGIHPIHQR